MNEFNNGDWSELADLFDELSELPDPQRQDRLDVLRRERPALAARLAAMLCADSNAEGLLERSLDELAPDLDARLHGPDWETRSGEAIGRYRLIEPIGSGGMGEVWLAERTDGDYGKVALKLLKRGMDTQAILRRFLQERSILARLSHPNIVRLLDGGMSDEGRPYYVMEHVAGLPLTKYASAKALGVRERAALVAAIADAVGYAHARLVVHRDLKPSNVLVDERGVPHLLDFGIAKLIEETGEQTLTGTGVRVLSPAYAAPEQILGDSVGTPADIYALGVLLYELVTGNLPHKRTSRDPAVLAGSLSQETGEKASLALARSDAGAVGAAYGAGIDARRLSREIAGDLDVIVAKALHPEAGRRYETSAAFADDLRRWLDGRPILARPDSARYRLGKFVRRHKLGVVAACVVVLTLVVGLGLALWQAGVAKEQAQRAERQAARTERVKAFLIDLFRQNDPARSHGESLTGEQMLERSRAGLATRFADDPQTQGELLVAIAEIEYALTDMDSAIATVNEGIGLLERAGQATPGQLGHAYYVRGLVYSLSYKPEEAEADMRRARALLASDPATDPDRIDSIDEEIVSSLRHTQTPADAVALQRQVLARSLARHGEDSPIVAERRVILALVLEEDGRYEEAEAIYRSAVPVLERARPRPDPFLGNAYFTYAGFLDRIGKSDESMVYFERALAVHRQLYGERSLLYGKTIFSRGITQLTLRRFDAAEADFRAALAAFPEDGNNAAHAHRYLGQALLAQKRLAEAAGHYQRAEALYRQADLPRDIQRWRAHADYGNALFQMGDHAGARAAVEAAIRAIEEVNGMDDVTLMRPLMVLGQIDRAVGRYDEAVAHHERWRRIVLTRLNPTVGDAMLSGSELVLDLIARNRPGDLDRAAGIADEVVTAARAAGSRLLPEYEQLPGKVAAARRHGR